MPMKIILDVQTTFVIAANTQNDNAPLAPAPPKVQAPPIGQNLQH